MNGPEEATQERAWPIQNPEGVAQMNGLEEATQESAWPLATLLPRKRGHSRVSAALWIRLVTDYCERVILGLYFLYLL